MSGPMVRATLTGAKTQTRRLIVPAPPDDAATLVVGPYHPTVVGADGDEEPGPRTFGAYTADGTWGCRCPFGAPGDRLWVREAGYYRCEDTRRADGSGALVEHFRYAGDVRLGARRAAARAARGGAVAHLAYLAPSASPGSDHRLRRMDHRVGPQMPRWASRLSLALVAVRAERVRAITPADARAEGAEDRDAFRASWDRFNGPPEGPPAYGWNADPWVWVLEYAVAWAATYDAHGPPARRARLT